MVYRKILNTEKDNSSKRTFWIEKSVLSIFLCNWKSLFEVPIFNNCLLTSWQPLKRGCAVVHLERKYPRFDTQFESFQKWTFQNSFLILSFFFFKDILANLSISSKNKSFLKLNKPDWIVSTSYHKIIPKWEISSKSWHLPHPLRSYTYLSP